MKFKIICVALIAVTLTACFGNKSDSVTPKSDPNPKPIQSTKPDYKKAALLNVEMGEKYLAMGQVARAKRKFMHALELMPRMPEAHSSVGFFYESVGDLEEAEQHHKQAIRYAEGSKGRFYNNYGTFLCRQKRFKEADVAFNKAIKDKLYIKTAEAYENAGQCALIQNDDAQAFKYFELAVKRDPQRSLASLELARIELQKGHYLLARDYLEKYRANADATAKSLWLAIQINKKLGNLNEVASAVMLLKGKFPNSVEYKQYEESLHG
jgi:type IV pilus assembly protein PilF